MNALNLNRALRTEARWERVLEILQESVKAYDIMNMLSNVT